MAKSSKFAKALGDENIPYLIGETAYIHEGDFNYLSNLVREIIKKDSCDAIKYHVLVDIDSYMAPSHKLYSSTKKFLFSKDKWIEILKKTKSNNFETIILADDIKAIDFAKNNIHLINAVELHAIALNNIEMLEKIKDVKVPIILGIGGSEIEDIEFAVNYLNRKDILLMHGFQNYPTKYEYINFKKMAKMKGKFKLHVGYADHTSWDSEFNGMVTLAGFMMGANILEKHGTLKAGEKRADYEAAISVDKLKDIRNMMDILNKAKGDGSFEIGDYEDIYAKKGPMKFTIVAKIPLKKGNVITKDNVTFKRTGEENSIAQREYLKLIGKKASRDIPKNSLVNWKSVKK